MSVFCLVACGYEEEPSLVPERTTTRIAYQIPDMQVTAATQDGFTINCINIPLVVAFGIGAHVLHVLFALWLLLCFIIYIPIL